MVYFHETNTWRCLSQKKDRHIVQSFSRRLQHNIIQWVRSLLVSILVRSFYAFSTKKKKSVSVCVLAWEREFEFECECSFSCSFVKVLSMSTLLYPSTYSWFLTPTILPSLKNILYSHSTILTFRGSTRVVLFCCRQCVP